MLSLSGPGNPGRLRQTLNAIALLGRRRRSRAADSCERYCRDVKARTAGIATALSGVVRSAGRLLTGGILNIDAVPCGTLLIEYFRSDNAGNDTTGLHDTNIEYAAGIDQSLRGVAKFITENRLQSLHREGSQAGQCIVSLGEGIQKRGGIVAGMKVRSPLPSRPHWDVWMSRNEVAALPVMQCRAPTANDPVSNTLRARVPICRLSVILANAGIHLTSSVR